MTLTPIINFVISKNNKLCENSYNLNIEVPGDALKDCGNECEDVSIERFASVVTCNESNGCIDVYTEKGGVEKADASCE